jgi:hypothetical protein
MSTPVTPAVIELVPTDPPQLAITRDGMTTTVTLADEDISSIHWLTGCWLASIEAPSSGLIDSLFPPNTNTNRKETP